WPGSIVIREDDGQNRSTDPLCSTSPEKRARSPTLSPGGRVAWTSGEPSGSMESGRRHVMRIAAAVSGSVFAVVLSMPSTASAGVDCIGPVGQANTAVDWSRKPIVAWECFKEGGQEDVQKQVGQDVNGTDIPGANIQIKLDQPSFDAHYKD